MSSGPTGSGRPPGQGLAAHRLAVAALRRVEEDGAFLHLALRGILRRSRVPDGVAAQATALAAGVLRWKSRLDYALSTCARRNLEALDPPVLIHVLRVAAFELGFSRTPAAVAVDLAVRQARAIGTAPAGFVNGVLRCLARACESGFPEPERGDPVWQLATRLSHPEWLVRRWVARFGRAEAEAILRADNEPAPVIVRTNTLRTEPSVLRELWDESGIEAEAGYLLDAALAVAPGSGPVVRLPGYEDGHFTPQNEASMLPSYVLSPAPGETVADPCAAPGGKTTHLAELSQDEARIVALDRHAARLAIVRRHARRLGLRSVVAVAADGRWLPLPEQSFDAVLLDAPCSDLGTIGRRPDVRWRRSPDDVSRVARMQRALMESAAGLLRPGGRLVYSVCSFEPEETTDHVPWVRHQLGLDVVDAAPFLPQSARTRVRWDDTPWLTLVPHRVRTDGFFVARFERPGRA